jgi:hypothetical protein
MKKTTRWAIVTHATSAPWVVMFLVWAMAMVESTKNIVYVPILVIHNCFIHEWYGRCALVISLVFLVLGFVRGPKRPGSILAVSLYAVVLGLATGYTVWWAVTGQHYEW